MFRSRRRLSTRAEYLPLSDYSGGTVHVSVLCATEALHAIVLDFMVTICP